VSVNGSQRADFPIVGSFNEDLVRKIDAQNTINMYEVNDSEGKKQSYLSPWPGLLAKGTFSEGVNGRGSIVFKGFAYFVVREDVYRMDTGLTITRISDAGNKFNTQSGFVDIAANETQIAFVDGARLLIWDTGTSTLTDRTSTLPAGVAPLGITYMDGRFILINGAATDTNKFYISNLDHGEVWDILNFALVNSRPTILSACSVLKRRIFLFGQTNAELWLDAGAADFPFRRDNNLLLEHGILARGTLVEGFDRLFYLSNDQDGVGGVMMVLEGTVPQKVSTREIDQAIQVMTTPEDATGFVFKINGEIFYQINFVGGDRTFVYAVSSNKWHELEMLNHTRHIANSHVFYNNANYVLGYNTDVLYELSNAYTNNNGENIRRSRIAHIFSSPTYERIRIDRLQIDMLQGVGLPNTLGVDSDPKIFLSISEDGGATYHDFGPSNVGKSGDRLIRTIWRRLGVRRDSIIKLEMFNNVQYYILGGAVDYEVLPE
jgi:hypothetical protein